MRMDVIKAIQLSFDHMISTLTKPFVLRKWLAWGFIALIAYSGSVSSFHSNDSSSSYEQESGSKSSLIAPLARHESLASGYHMALASTDSSRFFKPSSSDHFPFPYFLQEVKSLLSVWFWWVIAGVLALLAWAFLMLWLSSVFNFIYVHDISTDSYLILESFHRLKSLGNSYFLWQLAFGSISILIVACTLGMAYWNTVSGSLHGVSEILGTDGLVVVSVLLLFCACIIQILARDFVVPVMYVRGMKVLEAWRTVLPILRANAGQTMLYMLFLMVIAIVSAIYFLIALIAMVIVFLVLGAVLAAIGFGIYHAMGNSVPMGLAVVGGIVAAAFFLAFILLTSAAMQPVCVFWRVFSMILLGQADPSLAAIQIPRTVGSAPEGQV